MIGAIEFFAALVGTVTGAITIYKIFLAWKKHRKNSDDEYIENLISEIKKLRAIYTMTLK